MSTANPESSREWSFGPIPAEWRALPLKYVCSRSSLYGANIAAALYENDGVRFLRTTDIRDDGTLNEGGVFVPANIVADYMLSEGDFLISRSGTVGRSYVYQPEDGPCAYAGYLVRYVLRDPEFPQWLFYITKSPGFRQWLAAASIEATIGNVNGEKYANLLIPIPPLPQQRAITDYLDREMARMNALVAAKERVLGLLAEKRRALITRAVTRGLDANIAMRNADVPWLSEMPAHWSHRKIRFCCVETRTGGTPAPEFLDYEGEEGGLNWFTPGDFSERLILCRSKRRVAAVALDAGELRMFPSGAVLIVGIGATLGKVGLLRSRASANQQINALITCNDIDSVFLAYELSVLGDFMLASANMATLPILNLQRMGDVSLLVPPIEEQRTIVEHIARQTTNIDKVRIATERTIAILKERRAVLISAAITGQINVEQAV